MHGRGADETRGYTFLMSLTGVQHEIRTAKGADASAVVDLLDGIYEEGSWFVGDGPPSAGRLARRIRGADVADALFLVAAEGRDVVGWLELQRMVPSKMRHVAVLTIAVDRDRRRRGIATGLLRRAYAWTDRYGVEKISLNVRENNDAAIALYEREGFVREGREARQIRTESGYEANLLMAKFLSETA